MYYKLGMRTRIFCLAPTSQCVNSPTEAARARALLTAREARLPTNLRARRKLDFLRMTEVTLPFGYSLTFLSVTNWRHTVRMYAYHENTTRSSCLMLMRSAITCCLKWSMLSESGSGESTIQLHSSRRPWRERNLRRHDWSSVAWNHYII